MKNLHKLTLNFHQNNKIPINCVLLPGRFVIMRTEFVQTLSRPCGLILLLLLCSLIDLGHKKTAATATATTTTTTKKKKKKTFYHL